VAIDKSGDIFIADSDNNRVREVLPSGIIKTVAGDGSCAQNPTGNGGPATSASICVPTGVAVDSSGNLYISDTGHNQVRVVNSAGIINALAGNGGWGSRGDGGPATSAKLAAPTGVTVDSVHDVFIADTGNSKVRVVNAAGIIGTFAGTGSYGYGGDNGPASSAMLAAPTGVGIDPSGNIYISDTGNNRIRQVNTSNIISTYAGTGTAGYSGDGGPATKAQINSPTGAVAADGTHVYFADTGNNRMRGITEGPPPVIGETNYILLLPLSAALLAAGGIVIMRRRRTLAVPAI
jgi:sugar lactone lactonase YvrE